jgi:hypothetical protein
MDLRETVDSARGGLERLIGKVPGYKGYKDKELRREADKLLRMQVAARLDDQRKRLAELQMQLIDQAKIEYLDDVERAVMKLQVLIDRIRTASYGYAGLWDAVKVKEDQLDALYSYDNKMLDFAGVIASDVDKLTSALDSEADIKEPLTDLITTIEATDQTFGHRHEAILQAGPAEAQ